jgi:hypothetical protein
VTVEDRVRAATQAIAETVHDVRPLSLPSAPPPRVRGRHRWRHWAAPLTAAAAVAAIGIGLAIVQHVPNGQGVPPSRPAVSAGVPAYYVAIDAPTGKTSNWAVVGDTHTGARLATISPPAHDTFSGVTSAANDLTFVLGVAPLLAGDPFPPAGKEGSRSWYLLRIAPGTDHPARLTRLPIPATSADASVLGMALSPNGSELAVASQQVDPGWGPDLLRTYSVATGALLRTWTGPRVNSMSLVAGTGLDADPNAALSWTANGRTLAFGYGAGVRMLDVTRPGRNLIADSRLVFAAAQPGGIQAPSKPDCADLVVTSDGKTVVCAAVTLAARSGAVSKGTTSAWNGLEFLEYSTTTGKLTRTLYRYRANYSATSSYFFCVLWASASGDTLVGCLNIPHHPLVGVFTQGKFTRLSFPLPGGVPIPLPTGIAW